jgi:hypothetical protein
VAATGFVQPQRIPVDGLWPRRHVVSGAQHKTVKPSVSLGVRGNAQEREAAAREDLAGGESHGAWATGQHGKLQVTPQAAGLERGVRPGW